MTTASNLSTALDLIDTRPATPDVWGRAVATAQRLIDARDEHQRELTRVALDAYVHILTEMFGRSPAFWQRAAIEANWLHRYSLTAA